MEILENISLKPYNTFGVDVKAKFFCEVKSIGDLLQISEFHEFNKIPKIVLGEGSDILFTKDFEGLVLKDSIRGTEIMDEDENHVWIKASSGENWHKFVEYCVRNHWGGLENLALIPGNVGASPIQNIGAYGAEVKDCLHLVEFIELDTFRTTHLMNEACRFAYRRSVFKEERFKNKVYITSVSFQLNKNPKVNLSYKDLANEITTKEPDIEEVFKAVIRIRQRKLPDPKVLGNAGSFFKNPVISHEKYGRLQSEFPELKGFETQYAVKLSAAQLIDMCGWKGIKENNTGVYQHQPLVIVNYGGASGQDILNLAKKIQDSVYQKFGIELIPEVNIY